MSSSMPGGSDAVYCPYEVFKVGCASSVSQLFVSMRLVRAVRRAAAAVQDRLCWAGARRCVGQCLKVDY